MIPVSSIGICLDIGGKMLCVNGFTRMDWIMI